jgi:GTPase involved in cell partitioning and DNA repair
LSAACVTPADISPSKRKPIGGTGGRGGDVIIQSSRFVHDLYFASYVLQAGNGEDATGRGLNGRKGADKVILVPCGTIVKEAVRVRALTSTCQLPRLFVCARAAREPCPCRSQTYESRADDDDDDTTEGIRARMTEDELLSFLVAKNGRRNFVESLSTLAELELHKQQVVVARGGEPGHGNRHMRSGENVDVRAAACSMMLRNACCCVLYHNAYSCMLSDARCVLSDGSLRAAWCLRSAASRSLRAASLRAAA